MTARDTNKKRTIPTGRVIAITVGICASFGILAARLFFIQVVAHEHYKTLADEQHLRTADFAAHRGEIYAQAATNSAEAALYPLAVNQTLYDVYLNPTEITRPVNTAELMVDTLGVSYDAILERAQKEHDVYEPVSNKATEEQVQAIMASGLPGIYARPLVSRYYPDREISGHVTGFYGIEGDRRVGKYGIEGYWESELAGISHAATVALDRTGSIIPEGDGDIDATIDGADIVLTIDHAIQFETCSLLAETVEQYAADNGTAIVMETETGAIRALCNAPSYDPNAYHEIEDVRVLNNVAVFEAYEPGSVFKPIAMSIAIDQDAVTPSTVYEDMGEVQIADFTIKNFDKQAHGINTMTEVLQKSLNLGIIFATETVPNGVFYDYVKKFGFGEKLHLEISQETSGSLGKLGTFEDIYKATASYGQGITVTPIQMLAGFNVIPNRGMLVKPFIVQELRKSTGEVIRTTASTIRQVVRPETANTVSAMLVKVLDEGYDDKASVSGYYLAGKTGTAQIAERGEYGNRTNHTFVGFGPAQDPKFTILIKLNNVKNVGFASDSTTQMFRDLAEFLLQYYEIPPTR